jgi:hypothetical protein
VSFYAEVAALPDATGGGSEKGSKLQRTRTLHLEAIWNALHRRYRPKLAPGRRVRSNALTHLGSKPLMLELSGIITHAMSSYNCQVPAFIETEIATTYALDMDPNSSDSPADCSAGNESDSPPSPTPAEPEVAPQQIVPQPRPRRSRRRLGRLSSPPDDETTVDVEEKHAVDMGEDHVGEINALSTHPFIHL